MATTPSVTVTPSISASISAQTVASAPISSVGTLEELRTAAESAGIQCGYWEEFEERDGEPDTRAAVCSTSASDAVTGGSIFLTHFLSAQERVSEQNAASVWKKRNPIVVKGWAGMNGRLFVLVGDNWDIRGYDKSALELISRKLSGTILAVDGTEPVTISLA